MAMGIPSIHLHVPLNPPNFTKQSIPKTSSTKPRNKTQLRSTRNRSNSGGDLAKELETEKKKISVQRLQRLEAMRKSRELLFGALCHHLNLEVEEVKRRWGALKEEEKFDWVRGFVAEWGVSFHPLSVNSVKAMVEEHIQEENPFSDSGSGSSVFAFKALQKIMEYLADCNCIFAPFSFRFPVTGNWHGNG